MIEELVQQFEKEFETATQETAETESVDETEMTESVDEKTTETDESQKPVSLVASIVEQLEREMMTQDETESGQEPTEDKPTEHDEEESEPSEDETDEEESEPADESEPSEDETDESSDQLTALMNELQAKSKALDDERANLLERVEQAEQRAEQSEKQMKRLVLSHALANRDDIVDGRLIAELVDVDSLDVEEGKSIEETVTNRINDVVQKYGNVLAKVKGEKYVARDNGGLTTYEKIRPIGKPTSRAETPPFNSKQELLEEARERAEKGGQKERVAYLALKRKYGLK